MNRQEKELPPEFRYSAKNSAKPRIPEPLENLDYFEVNKFDCTVCFEIHISAHEEEDNLTIESRAYEAIMAGRDIECLGVMMKDREGSVCLDMDNKPFDWEAWIKQKSVELKIIRKERPLTKFIEI